MLTSYNGLGTLLICFRFIKLNLIFVKMKTKYLHWNDIIFTGHNNFAGKTYAAI